MVEAHFALISIHAPLTGGDHNPRVLTYKPGFQSTPPSREATIWEIPLSHTWFYFNPRPPHGRRRFCIINNFLVFLFQSTPPSREATYRRLSSNNRIFNFNPRPPHGRRRHPNNTNAYDYKFQSTPPSREATRISRTSATRARFQSTPPSREATAGLSSDAKPLTISIHAPLTGGDCFIREVDAALKRISIHAPLTGGDFTRAPPHKEKEIISIHAPLTGGDGLCDCNNLLRFGFQSTPPSREATAEPSYYTHSYLFQSTPPSREATAQQ